MAYYGPRDLSDLERVKRELFPEYTARIDMSLCPFCEEPVNILDFRDALSAKEFKISGLCQKCQDQTFRGE